MRLGERYLVISDLQIPFEAEHALAFCKAVQKEYGIPSENILNVGDEVDSYHGGRWPKDPDVPMTARAELQIVRQRLKPWYAAFPKMRLAVSNHGIRWLKKATAAEIPSELLRSHKEILGAPSGWQWKDTWTIKGSRSHFKMLHGLGYGGMYAYRTAAMDQGTNVIFGHLHANAGIAHIVTESKRCWGCNVGSLIDVDSFAFQYGKYNRFKPWLGVGVVLNGGTTPILVPYDGFKP